MPDVPRLGNATATLLPGLHMIGGLGPSAVYVIETSEGLVLVDTGLEPDGGALSSEITRLGLDPRRIKAILLTHVHGDHVGAVEALKRATGAMVYAGEGDVEVLRRGGPREAFFSTFTMPTHFPRPTPVDVAIDHDQLITVGDVRFRAMVLPGHTPGTVAYFLDRNGWTFLFAGDIVTMLQGEDDPHPKGLRPLGTYSAYLAPRYRGDVQTFLTSLQKLRAMPVPDLVLPGHPASDPVAESPRLTQRRWEEMLDKGIGDLELLTARNDRDGADFLDGNPKTLLPGLDYLGEHQGSAVYTLADRGRLILIDAPGGPGLREFVESRRKQMGWPPVPLTDVLLTSCGPDATSGLRPLLEGGKLNVYGPEAGLIELGPLCPPGIEPREASKLAGELGATMNILHLNGRGVVAHAYLLEWAGKPVLLSGRIPVLFDTRSVSELSADLKVSRENALEYLQALLTLEQIKPDLWLPTVPSDAQNANLYDSEWRHVITNNFRLGRSILDRTP